MSSLCLSACLTWACGFVIGFSVKIWLLRVPCACHHFLWLCSKAGSKGRHLGAGTSSSLRLLGTHIQQLPARPLILMSDWHRPDLALAPTGMKDGEASIWLFKLFYEVKQWRWGLGMTVGSPGKVLDTVSLKKQKLSTLFIHSFESFCSLTFRGIGFFVDLLLFISLLVVFMSLFCIWWFLNFFSLLCCQISCFLYLFLCFYA